MDSSVALVYKGLMRVISGTLGGQPIPGKSSAKMRPTSDKVREAIFDQLEARWIEDWAKTSVLDLFAGTGAFGIEALSRGAERATFVDHHLQTVQQITKTLESFELKEKSQVLCKGALEAIRWLAKKEEDEFRFDVIFLDPPYLEDWVVASLTTLHTFPLLKEGGLVIAEHDKRELITRVEAIWKVEDSRRYGDTQITFLTPKSL